MDTDEMFEQIPPLRGSRPGIDDVMRFREDSRSEVSRLSEKLDALVSRMDRFLQILSSAAEDDGNSLLLRKVGELVEQNREMIEANQAIIANLSSIDARIKRLYVGTNSTRRY
jgi:hypothetical protein